MSRIALTPNAAGTGTLTIAAPNTNSDRTITLPDTTGTVVLNEGSGTFKIDSSGNVGIGTSSPGYLLHVQADASPTIASTDTTNTVTTIVNSSNTAGVLGTATNHPVAFVTNNTERARIDSSGNLLVGTTSNTENAKMLLRFSGDGVNGMALNNFASTGNPTFFALNDTAQALNNTSVSARYTDTGATRWELRKNGGLANYSGNNVNLSDERVKTDISPVGSYWDKIKAIQVVTYKYRDQDHDDDNIGVIAQQVESVAPEFVSNDGFGDTPADGVPLKAIYEADLNYATLKALQEALTRIETLEAEVAALKGASA